MVSSQPSRSMRELLTLIITTSPTPSAPSTDLLSAVFEGFTRHCSGLLDCRVIVIFDNYDYVAAQPRLKKGYVTAEQAGDFEVYKENVKQLILDSFVPCHEDRVLTVSEDEAEYGSHCISTNCVNFTASQTADGRVTFIEPSRRMGFALAVRSALRMTETPYVWVQQHDWSLMADFPLESVLEIMMASEADVDVPVKYVCLPAVRMLSYATSPDVRDFPLLKELTSSLKKDFTPASDQGPRIPLTPMFFWHDKPHVASTPHYLARVFPSRLAVLRGDFIEDKIGQRARTQMKEGLWSYWATWLYYPDEGKQLCVRHLQGRTWRGLEKQSQQIATYRERNRKAQEDLSGA